MSSSLGNPLCPFQGLPEQPIDAESHKPAFQVFDRGAVITWVSTSVSFRVCSAV